MQTILKQSFFPLASVALAALMLLPGILSGPVLAASSSETIPAPVAGTPSPDSLLVRKGKTGPKPASADAAVVDPNVTVPVQVAQAATGSIPSPVAESTSHGEIDPKFLPTEVTYEGPYGPNTIVVDTRERFLYLVGDGGKARRYGVGVARPGFGWGGAHVITNKAEWPDWRPPAEMRQRQPYLPVFLAGGPKNPLGARAMYIGSTIYRIHGSNQPWSIGQAVSSGCIRMRNEDVMDLYDRVKVGTHVVVLE